LFTFVLGIGFLRNGGAESMSMLWWQFRRVGTAGLGIFALLLQLFASFGHVHTRDLLTPRALASAAAQVQTALSKSESAPGQEQIPGSLPDDDCPICMTMHMAASGLVPVPPSVAGPAEFAQVLHLAFFEEFSLGLTRHILFQTRAPPIA
jgi:hypothetical protein